MKRLILFIILIVIPVITSAQRFTVKVVAISDGDTFIGLNRDNLQLRFRIYGIDAPEKGQEFGSKAKDFLSGIIFGKNVTVDVQSQDGWGRHIAFVYTPDGQDVSLLMLQAGMAWHFVKYDNTDVYSFAEMVAKNSKKGLWIDKEPIAPWDFRSTKKK